MRGSDGVGGFGAERGDDAAQAQDASSSDQTDNENIVITATKRPQVLLDVPQSISVVSGANLEAQHATNFQDYLKLVPGLQLNQDTPGEGRLIVRGVNTGGVASTVSVYVDDTPFGSSSGLVNGAVLAGDFDTFDLNRIEVLRGPQGTLYGASSLSGVLRFVTNAPSTTGFEARARAGIEAVDSGGLGYNANAMVNVPLEFHDCVPRFGQFPQGRRLHRLHRHRRLGPCQEHQRRSGLRRPRIAAVQAESTASTSG